MVLWIMEWEIMLDALNQRAKDWWNKFWEPWTACMLCMVQGDVTVLTMGHALTAGKTGLIVATIMVFSPLKRDLYNLWLIGLVTACADYFVHSSHFGAHWTEAVVTGIVTMAIVLTYEKIRGKKWN